MNTTINIGEFGGVVAGLLIVGAILKNAFPKFPNRLIPLCTWLLGIIAYQTTVKGWGDPQQWLAAVLAAATATGIHSGLKNTVGAGNGSNGTNVLPPTFGGFGMILFLAATIGLTGCKTTLEQGGAYNSPRTNAVTGEVFYAPDTGLFLSDKTFEVAYAALDTAFKAEKENRELLFRAAPEIKHNLDKLRIEASRAKMDWAIARKAYLTAPGPATKEKLDVVLAELSRLCAAALAVLAPQ